MHRPVLLEEVLAGLKIDAGTIYVDGTTGAGGHAQAALERIGSRGRALLIDRDREALQRAEQRLARYQEQCTFLHGNFADLATIAQQAGIRSADAILLDVGVSSEQLDTPSRGFSFAQDGPLDMRMDSTAELTAADVVNNWSEDQLISIFVESGERGTARRIARAIVREREREPITTTHRLTEIVERARRGRRGKIHPATRVFQAIRMAVNAELESLDRGVRAAIDLLSENGRLAVISFHSLEDGRVKNIFREHEGRWESLAAGGRARVGATPRVRRLNRRPITTNDMECAENPRARSAKLRLVERITDGEEA